MLRKLIVQEPSYEQSPSSPSETSSHRCHKNWVDQWQTPARNPCTVSQGTMSCKSCLPTNASNQPPRRRLTSWHLCWPAASAALRVAQNPDTPTQVLLLALGLLRRSSCSIRSGAWWRLVTQDRIRAANEQIFASQCLYQHVWNNVTNDKGGNTRLDALTNIGKCHLQWH